MAVEVALLVAVLVVGAAAGLWLWRVALPFIARGMRRRVRWYRLLAGEALGDQRSRDLLRIIRVAIGAVAIFGLVLVLGYCLGW